MGSFKVIFGELADLTKDMTAVDRILKADRFSDIFQVFSIMITEVRVWRGLQKKMGLSGLGRDDSAFAGIGYAFFAVCGGD